MLEYAMPGARCRRRTVRWPRRRPARSARARGQSRRSFAFVLRVNLHSEVQVFQEHIYEFLSYLKINAIQFFTVIVTDKTEAQRNAVPGSAACKRERCIPL